MTLKYEYIADDKRPELHIEGIKPIYFDGSVNRIRRYMHTQHSDGRIHEPSFCNALVEIMQRMKPKVVYDVGAFIGYFALMAAAASDEDCRVYTFEMNDENYRHVAANIVMNKHLAASRIISVCTGVTNKSEYAKPITIRGFQMFEGGLDEIDTSKVHNPNFNTATESAVDLVSLDDFSQRHGVVPDLIKMDIEGWECRAVQGSDRLIREFMPTLLIEIHADRKLQEFDMNQRSFIQMVRDYGYEICIFGDHKQRKEGNVEHFLAHMTDEEIARHTEGENGAIVAVHPSKLAMLDGLVEFDQVNS